MPRVKQFSEAEVLEKGMELFWKQGFHATSIQNLVDHLGINRASLYDTFGGKKAFFQKAFALYRNSNKQRIEEFLANYPSVKEGLRYLLLSSIEQVVNNQEDYGCLTINCTVELLPHDKDMLSVLQENKAEFEAVFYHYLLSGVQNGEISKNKDLKAIASYFYTFYGGLKVMTKVEKSRQKLEDVIQVGLSVLEDS